MTQTDTKDRRRHVRVTPAPELPADVAVANTDSLFMVVDVSIGGVGLWVQRGPGHELGQRLNLQLKLGPNALEVDAEVRHRSSDGQLQGMEFVDVAPEVRTIINRYVGELAERGCRA